MSDVDLASLLHRLPNGCSLGHWHNDHGEWHVIYFSGSRWGHTDGRTPEEALQRAPLDEYNETEAGDDA